MTHLPFLLDLFLYSVTAFFVALVCTNSFVSCLQRWKIGKNIREESIDGKGAFLYRALHLKKSGTPTMGGILIWGTVLFVILLSRFLSFTGVIGQSLLQRGEVYLPLFTLISMGILGAIDDYLNVRGVGKKRGLEALPKMIFLLLFAAAGALWFSFKLEYSSIHLPGLGDFDIGLWYIPLFIFIIVATANAVNFTDGLDGLAGGLLIIAYAAFVVIAYVAGLPFLAGFCATIIGALLAFLWFNVPPARFFMGDTGSLALGATLGVMAMMIDAVAILPLVGFIFVIEALSIILQLLSKKLRNGKKIFRIAPIHHHFEEIGWTESQVVMRFWILGAIFAVFGLIIGLVGMGDKIQERGVEQMNEPLIEEQWKYLDPPGINSASMKTVAQNKKAFFDYEILKKYEAGISLSGPEIKSIREGNVNLKGSFVSFRNTEVFWKGGYIKHWKYATQEVINENRDRKLLLKKKEISELEKSLNENGTTIIPISLKLVRGRAKLDIALARGKKKYDKRDSIKKRDAEREAATRMKGRI